MRLLLLSALLPLLLYCIVYFYACAEAKNNGAEKPKFLSSKLVNAFLLSLVITVIVFMVIYVGNIVESDKNDYISPAQQLQKRLLKNS